jgi:hypothetical protein
MCSSLLEGRFYTLALWCTCRFVTTQKLLTDVVLEHNLDSPMGSLIY